MNRDLNPKRDLSELTLQPLFMLSVLLDEAWWWHGAEEWGNKLDQTALIFHSNDGRKSEPRWKENIPDVGSSSSSLQRQYQGRSQWKRCCDACRLLTGLVMDSKCVMSKKKRCALLKDILPKTHALVCNMIEFSQARCQTIICLLQVTRAEGINDV